MIVNVISSLLFEALVEFVVFLALLYFWNYCKFIVCVILLHFGFFTVILCRAVFQVFLCSTHNQRSLTPIMSYTFVVKITAHNILLTMAEAIKSLCWQASMCSPDNGIYPKIFPTKTTKKQNPVC